MIPFVHEITYGASFTTESGRNRQTDEQYVHIAWEKLEFLQNSWLKNGVFRDTWNRRKFNTLSLIFLNKLTHISCPFGD